MPKTAQAVNAKRTKIEIVVSAEMVAALASLTTVETIDMSSIAKSISGGGQTRVVNKEYVTGDATPILDYDTNVDEGDLVINMLHTNGKETLGTDNLDIPAILNEIINHTAVDLSVQFIWSVAGGAVGDEERLTHPTETYLIGLTDPVGGVDDSAKVQQSLTLSTSAVTLATVT